MTTNTLSRLSPAIVGPLWMFGMVGSLSFMAIAVREITPEIHVFQMMAFRAGIGLLLVAPFALRHRKALHITRPPVHVFRGIIVLIAQVSWFFAVIYLPLAMVFAIEFTAPAWVAIMALIFLAEPLNRGRIVAVLLGFAGVMIIIQPGNAELHWAMFAALTAAVLFAGNFVLTRLFATKDSLVAILWAMHLVLAPVSILLALFQWTNPTAMQLFWLCSIGATGIATNYCMTRALAIAEAAIVVPIDFLRLPIVAVAGAMLYDEPLAAAVIVGAGLIFAGNYYNILFERRRRLAATASAQLVSEAD